MNVKKKMFKKAELETALCDLTRKNNRAQIDLVFSCGFSERKKNSLKGDVLLGKTK